MNSTSDIRAARLKAARTSFGWFSMLVQSRLEMTDFHFTYYRILGLFATGVIKKLIITVPPQHGKSEGSTRLLPAFVLGQHPDKRIAIASYSDPFARKFNRDVQRIIDTPVYAEIFPDTRLNGKNIVTVAAAPLRNSAEFEIVGHTGSLKAVGRGGPLTGNPVDVMVLDDLYKDAMEANSPTIRGVVWEWYTSVVKTRLPNWAQELIVFTRWHEDDLIGRIEQCEKVIEITSFDDISADWDGWYKLNFEAIKESEPTEIDPREMGVPLWPERHSLKLLTEKRALDRHTFDCLYQGHPMSKEGALYGDRFQTYDTLPETVKKANYTDVADTGTDKLCSVCYEVGIDGKIYVVDVLYTSEPMEVTEVATPAMIQRNGTRQVRVESNNGGRSFARVLDKALPTVAVEWFHQTSNKEARILTNAATVLKMIVMPVDWRTRWPEFYGDLISYKRVFRANAHDDAPDVLTGIVETELDEANQYSRIYPFEEAPMRMRYFNIYSINPKSMSAAGIVQLGFGGDMTVNVRELCYARGFRANDYIEQVRKIIEMHGGYLDKIMQALRPGQDVNLTQYHLLPHVIISRDRADLMRAIDEAFNYKTERGRKVKDVKVVVLPSKEATAQEKSIAIEHIKKLTQIVDPASLNYLSEIKKYRYESSASKDERIPVGSDYLLDAALNGMRHILEDVLEKKPYSRDCDMVRKQVYEQIKNIEI